LAWTNQFGRFLNGYASKTSCWHIYFMTWPEMVAPWTPLAAAALARPRGHRGGEPKASADGEVLRFLRIWAVAPLLALSLSQARARFYAVPVLPANALLVA